MKAREKAVADKETALAEQEAAQTQKQAELDALAASLDAKQIELTSAVAMFSNMDSEKAAKALSGIKNPADRAAATAYGQRKICGDTQQHAVEPCYQSNV